jgi:hypothetical protein
MDSQKETIESPENALRLQITAEDFCYDLEPVPY